MKSFWDVVGNVGQKYRTFEWNLTKNQAMEESVKELRAWIEYARQFGEKTTTDATNLARLVFTRYMASVEAIDILSNCTNGNPVLPTKEQLYSLKSDGLRYFTCILQTHRMMCELWHNQELAGCLDRSSRPISDVSRTPVSS